MRKFIIFFAYERHAHRDVSFGNCLIDSDIFPAKSKLMQEVYKEIDRMPGSKFRGITGAIELDEESAKNWIE